MDATRTSKQEHELAPLLKVEIRFSCVCVFESDPPRMQVDVSAGDDALHARMLQRLGEVLRRLRGSPEQLAQLFLPRVIQTHAVDVHAALAAAAVRE